MEMFVGLKKKKSLELSDQSDLKKNKAIKKAELWKLKH